MNQTLSPKKPDWLKIRPPGGDNFLKIKTLLRQNGLSTVCEEARCPNLSECWGGGTVTMMLMGDTCTRGCRFCHVKSGNPQGWLDTQEPEKVAGVVSELGLRYLVLTSVDRDDLPDGGADHFAKTVEAIKSKSPDVLVEVLIPDFHAEIKSLERIVASNADVIAHNLETIRRLTPKVRDPRSGYDQSLSVLEQIKKINPHRHTKSSLMVGLGETQEEIIEALKDLRRVGTDIVTLGQYLRPSDWNLPVEEYLHPTVFKSYEEKARELGFLYVASGPLVRSSYRAGELFMEGLLNRKGE